MKPHPPKSESSGETFAAAVRTVPVELVRDALIDCLSAETVARDGTRQPDYRVRKDVAALVLQYAVGRPTEAPPPPPPQVEENTEGLLVRLTTNPSLLQAFKRLIQRAEAQAASRDEKP
jgi:hypothetical protein